MQSAIQEEHLFSIKYKLCFFRGFFNILQYSDWNLSKSMFYISLILALNVIRMKTPQMVCFHDSFSLVNDNFKVDSLMVKSVMLLSYLIVLLRCSHIYI